MSAGTGQFSQMEVAWLSFIHAVGIHDADPLQLLHMRRAFYAGAAAFHAAQKSALDPANGDEPTSEEEIKFQSLRQELRRFMEQVKRGEA